MAPHPGSGSPAPTSSLDRSTRGQYILLIDDDDTILDVLVTLLRDEEGYRVVAAHSGSEALRVAPPDPPALVFMDVMLHREVVEDVLRDLRAHPGWEAFALVVCTAMPNIHELAQQLGSDAYLAKPFDLDDLLGIVEHFGPPR